MSTLQGRERYDWDEATQGFLLSAFYYGYVLTHLPGGLLAEKFGGKWTIGIGLLVTSVATTLTPLAVYYGGAIGLFIIRVIEGCGEVRLLFSSVYSYNLAEGVLDKLFVFFSKHRLLMSCMLVK